MGLFTDSKGRVWAIELDPHTLARVRRAAGLDTRAPIEFDALLTNENQPRAAAVLWAIVQPFARTAGIDVEDFTAETATSAILDAAREAVAEAQLSTFETDAPEPPTRSPFRTA